MRRFIVTLAALTGFAFAADPCFAQAQGLFNTGSTTNQGGAQGLGQGGQGGGTAQPGGGIGTGAGLGQGGETSGVQLIEFGAAGAQIGQGGFVGQANGTGEFIGLQGGTQGQGQAGTTPRFTQAGGGQGGQGFQQDNQQGTERRIRPRYRLAFSYATVSPATVVQRSRQQVETFQSSYNLPPSISVELDDSGTVILRGEAESDEMSRLIANVLRLEPGVRAVRNELVVADQPTPQ